MSKNIQIKLLTKDGVVPKKQHALDIGYDIYSSENVELLPKKVTLVSTSISIGLPSSVGGFVLPRSGVATRYQVTLINSPGLIDPGYTGELLIPLINHSEDKYAIVKHDRIAQLVLLNVENREFEIVESLTKSERSSDGFGSTG
ncbi:dUTP diphosphatase [Acidimicrobiia bacterium]|nr:dUTP diphosphatase [Acidimicrobiia bacterium]